LDYGRKTRLRPPLPGFLVYNSGANLLVKIGFAQIQIKRVPRLGAFLLHWKQKFCFVHFERSEEYEASLRRN
jgi:hypothetical protein